MWILLTKKLPTKPSPPKLSIFWSVPWPNLEIGKKQIERQKLYNDVYFNDDDQSLSDETEIDEAIANENNYCTPLGMEPNFNTARKIRFADEDIKIFTHEYSSLSASKMKFFIDEGMYEFVPEGAASENLLASVNGELDKDGKAIYDAALLDGCNHEQALATAMGIDLTVDDPEFPPLGWYRIKKEFGYAFAYVEELEEDRTKPPEREEKPTEKKRRKTAKFAWFN